ncbi:MAG: nitronate monooxygenase [Pseudobacteriovorax sp.]|nr:nitronate monooxygenase [Pseudobacteriovorax sp.]
MSFAAIKKRLRLPLVGAPMFIVSGPELVLAQCKSGIIGSFPALNARPQSELTVWLKRIKQELADYDDKNPDQPSAPYAVNQIVHKSNNRLDEDVADCVEHKVPIVITSLGARTDVNDAIHSYGGLVFHDVINNKFAKKAIDKGADGLIAVAAGAGGHAGTLSPLVLIAEIREWFDGPLFLSGGMSTGASILAAEAMGADCAYMGSAFIATHEANAVSGYKDALVQNSSQDIVYTNLFTGVHGNYLKPSIVAAGLDPDNLPESDPSKMNFGSSGDSEAKAWRDIWGCGQGIGPIKSIESVSNYIARIESQYQKARAELLGQ